MFAISCIPASFGFLAAIAAATATPAPDHVAEWQRGYLEPAIHAWTGVVTMLAEDGEREGEKHDDGGRNERGDRGRHHGRMHAPGHWHHANMGPRTEGPRADAISMLQDISRRLARIERMLDTRGRGGPPTGGPGRGEWRGEGRPEMSSAVREMMQARMAKMKEAREKWEKASPEEREKMKREWESRMKEGHERMERPRSEKEERSGDVDRMKQAMERMREEGHKRMEDAKAKMEEARGRFQQMETRLKQLEAEVTRLNKTAEKDN